MKKLHLLTLLLLTISVSYAQYEVPEEDPQQENEYPHSFYFGLGTGINSNCGMMGLLAEVPLNKGFSINGGLGLGGWGFKSSIGVRYHPHFPYKVYYGVSFTSASGISGMPIEQTTESTNNQLAAPVNETKEIEVDLLRANNIAIAIGYDVKIFSFTRFNFEFGYSIPLDDKPYKLKDSSQELTSETELLLDLMSPGGLIIGLGLTFGIN